MAGSANDFIDRYTTFIIRQRWLVIIACVLVTLGLGRGVRNITFAADYRVFFGENNPDLIAFEALEQIYTKNDRILFVIHANEGSIFNEQSLDFVRSLTYEAWQITASTRVDSITNFQHSWADGEDLAVGDLLPAGPISADAIARVRQVALNDPLVRRRFVALDERTTAVSVRIETQASEALQAAEEAHALVTKYAAAYPDHTFALVGSTMLNEAWTLAPREDSRFALPLMLSVLVVMMVIVLRSVLATVATLVLTILAAVSGLGAAGWLDTMLDPASASAPTIILTLAIAGAVHVFVIYFAALRRGAERADALRETVRINAMPIFLTSVTTAVGFLSLNFSDSPPYHILGNIAAGGVMLAWLYTMTFLPAVISLMQVTPWGTKQLGTGLSAALSRLVVAKPKAVFVSMSVVVTVLASFVTTLQLSDNIIEYFGPKMQIRRDTEFANAHLAGLWDLSFSIDSGQPQGINDPEFLDIVDRFIEWALADPRVIQVNGYPPILKRLNKNMHRDEPSEYRLPDGRELAAQYLLMYQMSLPYGLDVNDQINVDQSALRVNIFYDDVLPRVVSEHAAEAAAWFEDNGTPSMRNARGISTVVMFNNIAKRNIESMILGTGVGFFAISLILILALRDIRLGMLSLLPNILPAAVAFGIWALIVGEVGFAISIVAGLSIGIIVDNTVHFLVKYQYARDVLHHDTREAVVYAFEIVVPALIGTTVIVALGFAMLGFSAFRVTSYMGTLTALAIICALIIDLLLLPAILILFDRDEHTESDSAAALAT